jgi:hypothetical protein
MVKHNPMFSAGLELLKAYTTRIPCFSNRDFQIICVNNSSVAFTNDHTAWQGVLHTADILTPDASKRRIINSTMIASVSVGTPNVVNVAEQDAFVTTTVVRRRGYDKLDLEDDA